MSELQRLPTMEEVSEPVSEMLHDLPSYIARGLVYLILSLAVAAGIYSTIGQIDELVTAPGTVAPLGLSRPVQAAAAGRITRLAVQEGDHVVRDQALVYLETESAGAALERATRERDIRKRQLQDQLAGQAATAEIAETRARLAQSESALSDARRTVEASIAVAPEAGTVSRRTARGVGEMVQPGQSLLEISPLNAPLIFHTAVASADIGRLKVGQPARIKVHAFPHQEYGVVEGTVVSISPDTQPQAGEASAYRVMVHPNANSPVRAGKPITLRLGLTATVEISTGRRRIIELFLKQLRGGQG